MSETKGRPEDTVQRPRPRIQSLSDLIFGLALSIGALNLITSKPTDTSILFGSIATFGFSFLILIFVWFRYTEVMSVLPVETGRTRALNTAMLFLVAIEPYLFNQISFGFSMVAPLPQDIASTAYALDIGGIWAILAAFTHVLTIEEKKLLAPDLLRSYRQIRNAEIIITAIFFVSILPVFWTEVSGTSLRYYLWAATFFVQRIRALYSHRVPRRSRSHH